VPGAGPFVGERYERDGSLAIPQGLSITLEGDEDARADRRVE
jgi:hypothetical protein